MAAGNYAQWLHSLNREDIPVRIFDFWVASDEYNRSRARSTTCSASRIGSAPLRFARVEAWLKQYEHVLEQNTAGRSGRARRRVPRHVAACRMAFDVLLRQLEIGPFSGWLAYTYGVSSRTRDTRRRTGPARTAGTT